MTTATHANRGAVVGNREEILEIGEDTLDAALAQGSLEDVDNVFHYWSVYISRPGLSGSESGFSTFSSRWEEGC